MTPPPPPAPVQVQMFGLKGSRATRAAERFFKERRVKVIFVDLGARPIARGELDRFVQRFGLTPLLDLEGRAYEKSGLSYLRVTDESLTGKVIADPELLRLPLVRAGRLLAVGEDTAAWEQMVKQP